MLAMYSGQIGSFSSRDLLLFFIMWELELIPVYLLSIHVGRKETSLLSHKIYFVHGGGFHFSLNGVLGVGLYGSNEPTLNFETSVNQSYPVALEIIFYIGFLIAFAVKLPILTPTYMVTRYPRRGTLQYLYASSLIKKWSVWIDSD
uniref:Putative NADH:quinone oxidoreductase/Mrp antiporter, membrane subunit n=1 Tax=Helianthus annuus TaxID=4232 RepID=A0A1Y3BU67_HELAN